MRAKTLGQKLGAFTRFRPRLLKPRIALAEGLTDLTCGLNMGQTAEVLAASSASRASGRTSSRCSRTSAPSPRGGGSPRRSCRSSRRRTTRQSRGRRAARGPDARGAGQAQAVLRPQERHGHGRQLVPGNRRRRGAAGRRRRDRARKWQTPPLGRIRSFAFAGLSPRRMGLGPAYAMAAALDAARRASRTGAVRAQRGLRRAGHRCLEASPLARVRARRAGPRPCARRDPARSPERERRRDRARASGGRERRAAPADAAQGDAAPRASSAASPPCASAAARARRSSWSATDGACSGSSGRVAESRTS